MRDARTGKDARQNKDAQDDGGKPGGRNDEIELAAMALGEEECRGQTGVGGLDFFHGRKLVVDVRVVPVVVAVLDVVANAADVTNAVAASTQDGINGSAMGFLVSKIVVVVFDDAYTRTIRRFSSCSLCRD